MNLHLTRCPFPRLMFSRQGQWLTIDSSSPIFGWDPREFIEGGKKYGCTSEDLFGCFYFHVKGELAEFAQRLRRFKINIHVTSTDAHELAAAIKGRTDPSLSPFSPPCFDRVETSNLSDFAGVAPVLEDWDPLLNPSNKRASVLMYSMNWHRFGTGDIAHLLGRPDSALAQKVIVRSMQFQVRVPTP